MVVNLFIAMEYSVDSDLC